MEDQLYGVDKPQLYGVNAGKLPTPFRQKLADLFQSSDFVRVINIDDERFVWQSLDPKDETYNIVAGPQKDTRRGLPKLYSIEPGQSMVLEGWNAYIMIDKLYKKVSAKDRLARRTLEQMNDKKHVTNFVWDDEEQQRQYINRIFVGIEQPQFSAPSAAPMGAQPYQAAQLTTDSVSDIAKDLGLDQPSA